MTMREHLGNTHEKLAAHHVEAAKQHAALAKCFSGMEKSAGVKNPEDFAAAHDALAKQHADIGEFHLSCCETLGAMGKTAGWGESGDAIRPDGVSSIIGEIPDNLRPIFRSGQRDYMKIADTVDAGLGKVIGITEGDA
jgi:hypothetical protein